MLHFPSSSNDLNQPPCIESYFNHQATNYDEWITRLCHEFLSSNDITPLSKSPNDDNFYEIPENQWNMPHYLHWFEKEVLPQSSHLASPTYIGHMTSSLPSFVGELSKLITMMNQNLVKVESCRGLSNIERQVLGMLHREIYQYPNDFYTDQLDDMNANFGCFTSGGTLANISALWMARNKYYQSNPEHKYQEGWIIGSELMHYSFDKAADLLGLRLIRLPTNKHHQLSIDALNQTIIEASTTNKHIIAVIGIAGTTDFGSIDPLQEIALLAKKQAFHFHVDAAWGGAMIFASSGKKLLRGIEHADTITIDGHKQLMTPMGCGLLITKYPDSFDTVRQSAPYTIRRDSKDQGRFTLEGSRPAMALYLHAALHLFGKNGYAQLMDKSLQRAKLFASLIQQHEAFELLHQPAMNLVAYRYLPINMRHKELSTEDNEIINVINQKIQEQQSLEGKTFVSRTQRNIPTYNNQSLVLFRAVLLNPLTTEEHLKQVLENQVKCALSIEVAR